MTLFGLEKTLKAPKGGGTVKIYKKGAEWKPSDEEAQRESFIQLDRKENSQTGIQRFAERGGSLSWDRVGYTINANGKEKVLLANISGYIKPGRMTALMGGISPCYCGDSRIRSREDYFIELSCAEI